MAETSIRRAVDAGRLHRLHRGVYAVGHRSLSWRGRWLAAVLAAGDGAILSHTSAAALWQYLRPIPGPVHVLLGAAVRRKFADHRLAVETDSWKPLRRRSLPT